MVMETRATNLARLPGSGEDAEPYRAPPVNYEAEQALLGAILANNAALEKVAEFLLPEHFAEAVHGRIYEACTKLIERGQIADAVQLKNLFEQDGSLADAGGAQYIAKLQASAISIINAGDYGRTVHDLYMRRQLIELGEDVVNDAFDQDLDKPASEQIEAAEQKLYSLSETGEIEGGFQAFSHALVRAVEMAEAARKRDGHIAGVPTGFTDLDRLLGGLQRSDLLVLAGRPSMGKTALATNIAFNAARIERKQDERAGVIGFFSLEMSAEQLATRILAETSEVPSEKIRRGELSDADFDRVVQASAELSSIPLFIDDSPAISVSQLRTRTRRLKRQQGLSLIVVDYLQLMRPAAGARVDNRVQEVSDITRGLKAIAKELDVPVLALSQLSRAVEQREDKRPLLSDLRESGSIEQDSDVVMFVYREQYYLERAQPTQRAEESDEHFQKRHDSWHERCEKAYGIAEVIVAKQRHGPIGTRRLNFHGATTKFSDFVDSDHLPDATY
jgi:replicative DNA helicase